MPTSLRVCVFTALCVATAEAVQQVQGNCGNDSRWSYKMWAPDAEGDYPVMFFVICDHHLDLNSSYDLGKSMADKGYVIATLWRAAASSTFERIWDAVFATDDWKEPVHCLEKDYPTFGLNASANFGTLVVSELRSLPEPGDEGPSTAENAEAELREYVEWSFWSIVLAAVLAGIGLYSFWHMTCGGGHHDESSAIPAAIDGLMKDCSCSNYEALEDQGFPLKARLYKEMGIALICQPAAGLACGLIALKFNGGHMPGWSQAVGLLPVIRSSWVDALITQSLETKFINDNPGKTEARGGWVKADAPITVSHLVFADFKRCPTLKLPFLLSKLEVLDTFSDGVALAAATWLHCTNAVFRARALAAFGAGGPVSVWEPILSIVGLPGLMSLSIILAAHMQFRSCQPELDIGEVIRPASYRRCMPKVIAYRVCDLCGFGAAAEHPEICMDPSKSAGFPAAVRQAQTLDLALGTFAKHLSRSFCENTIQLALQGSIVMASGKGFLAQPSLAFSMTLSSVLALQKAYQMFVAIDVAFSECGHRFVAYTSWAILVALIAWSIVRVWFAEACDSKIWGVFSGCVYVDDSLLPQQ